MRSYRYESPLDVPCWALQAFYSVKEVEGMHDGLLCCLSCKSVVSEKDMLLYGGCPICNNVPEAVQCHICHSSVAVIDVLRTNGKCPICGNSEILLEYVTVAA